MVDNPASNPAFGNDIVANQEQVPDQRPEVSQPVMARVKQWITDTDNLVQRANALWEFREANKALFPARFNVDDPRRGQTPVELKSGRDKRRVQTPYIFRDSLQITAMVVPDDITFKWDAMPQVEPPPLPTGPPTVASSPDPMVLQFARTLTLTQRLLLDEAGLVPTLQAWVQDSGIYPAGILKFTFRRDYQTASISATPGDRDMSDGLARLQSLIQQFTARQFDKNTKEFSELSDLVLTLKTKARISKWYGVDLQLVQMDAFGVSEDATDLINIYDAAFMFHDVLMTGTDILARFPYKVEEDGSTSGVLLKELSKAAPWDTNNTSTDPNARNRASRNKQLTAPRATPVNSTSTSGATGVDPKQRRFVVREIWSKRDRMRYTIIRGLDHYVEKIIPQKTSERWYPFAILVPNRVPGELYGASDLELKRDIQDRIHRKRTDEEKARWLSIDRYIYDNSMIDGKEIGKLGDIPPGQFKGVNFGGKLKVADVVMPLAHQMKPESFDTSKDERDKDMMGALPVQALGTTGQANFATEANMASQGMAVATNFRQAIVRREIEGMLTALAEVLVQELSPEEVTSLGGPFAYMPEVMEEDQAEQIEQTLRQEIEKALIPQVLMGAMQEAQATGIPPDPMSLQHQLEQQAEPMLQQEIMSRYGTPEIVTRRSLYQKLRVKVTSSFASRIDKQQNLGQLGMLSGAVLQIAQMAQATMTPFNPRPLFKHNAVLIGGDETVDEIFPAPTAAQLMAPQQPAPGAGAPAGGPGTQPDQQGNQPNQAPPEQKAAAGAQGAPQAGA